MAEESKWSGFYKLPISERRKKVSESFGLNREEEELLTKEGPLPLSIADKMSENVIGTIGLPLSIAPNFIINGRETVVPMATEEPSVVAAASNSAKMARAGGGFRTSYTGSVMIGQIQMVGIKDVDEAVLAFEKTRGEMIKKANKYSPSPHAKVVDASARRLNTDRGKMVVVEFLIDVSDAMGANMVNTILEKIAPEIVQLLGGEARMKILSNLATRRMAGASAIWKKEEIGGEEIVDAVLDAWSMAMADIYRRATHNKGAMNGIDAVALACGQDWRAIEAGAHTYCAMKDAALTTFRKTPQGDLKGKIILPMAVGTVGGSLGANATAKLSLKILGVKNSGELAQVMAAVGLAQNFAALRALVSEGIQKGHMKLHARHLASAAGAGEGEMEKAVNIMIEKGMVNAEGAKKALGEIREGRTEKKRNAGKR